ncbi:uncharacterized protein [Temnothorax nylanderi]|uniref:uncharacterized protein isoform X2 n=1 Tax=Temnothorax nylanderi TaxID=102681 RepID=UPI003A8743F0
MDLNNANDLQNSSNIWSVVEFVTEQTGEIEVVPTSWLEQKEDKIFCKWPKKNPRKCIRKNTQPDSSWEMFTVELLIQYESYQDALNYTKKKSNSETETSCSQLGKGKRRKKHKNQDVSHHNSDSDHSHRITPPPSITIPDHDIQTDPCDELLHDEAVPSLPSQQLNNEGSDFNNKNGTSAAIVNEIDKEVQENNIAAVTTNTADESFVEVADIIKDSRTDNYVTLKILENVLATKKMVEQQNEFLKQLDSRININLASKVTAARNSNILTDTTNIIPTKPFNKYKKLLEFDDGLKANIAASKQLETFFYLLGGNSAQTLCKNGLEKLFTNKLGSKCSWFGRKENYQLNLLRIMEILKNRNEKNT